VWSCRSQCYDFYRSCFDQWGPDTVEEFLAGSLWPLNEKFGFEVETTETPLLKFVVLMPQVTPITGAQELGSTFEARIANAACSLVGNYNIAEHKAYRGLHHGRLNRVFELVAVHCQPHLEPLAHKWKTAAPVPPPQTTSKKLRCPRGPSRLVDWTSIQEVALAKVS
jgi:hypothetical protein